MARGIAGEPAERSAAPRSRGILTRAAGTVAVLVAAWPCGEAVAARQTRQADVVVFGATASGVMAAVAAREQNASVILVEPGRHVGGMVSGGLGKTDMVRQERVIGGLTRQFFERLGKHYGEEVAWTFEPSVAERTFNEMLAEAGVAVIFEQPLVSVETVGRSIARIDTLDHAFAAPVFIDCSYEGDLMKAAGVSYVVGREGRDRYGESLAGRREIMPGQHQAIAPVSPFGPDGKLLPYVVRQQELPPPGAGDGKFQMYGFRLCLTDAPENRIPISRPENYDPERFGLVRNYFQATKGQLKLRHLMCLSRMPNHKTDINACGFVSTAPPGAAWDYPEADAARRRQIAQEHLDWAHGFLYFLQNEDCVPESIRQEIAPLGLPKDEFADTGHWPHQFYIREGRRMCGEHVVTQHDLQEHRQKYDSIGMAGYNIDIREVQWVACEVSRFPVIREEVLQEGYLSYPVEPWEIPYRALLPRIQECDNLLVPVCASMSTVAYASYRMEPQYMIAGQAAGAAAALAVQSGSKVHRIDLNALQNRLRERGQILSLEDAE